MDRLAEDNRTNWTIRAMSASDIKTVARLRHDAFFADSPRTIEVDAADLRDLIDASGEQAAIVAISSDCVVGSCLLVANELEPMHDVSPWLAGLVVDPGCRKLGIGTALVRGIERSASDFGVGQIYLYTGPSEGFYERLGWSVVDRFLWSAEPSALMRRDLTVTRPRP